MPRYKSLAVMVSIVLAVCVPVITALKANADKKSYPSIRVDIEPYDPRDLLRGQYLQFKIKWNFPDPDPTVNPCYGDSCCLCIGEGEINPVANVIQCAPQYQLPTQPSCKYLLKGNSAHRNVFDVGISRYYLDENHALPMERLFRDGKEKFSVALGIKENGSSVLQGLYVGNETMEDYVARHKGRIPENSKSHP